MQFFVKTSKELLNTYAEDDGHRYVFGTPESGKLHYFAGLSNWQAPEDTFFVMAVIPDVIFEKWYSTDNGEKLFKEKRDAVVGCIELQINPFNKEVLWLKYISVDPLYRRQGIASQLIQLMVEELPGLFQARGLKTLERSRPSEAGACVTDKIGSMLTVPWTQP